MIATIDSNIPPLLDHHPVSSGAPVLASVSKGVPGIFMDCHMMVSEPEKVGVRLRVPIESVTGNIRPCQWVNDIANAGGSLYCFHIEATCLSSVPQ